MKKITLLLMLFVGMLSYGQIWSIASCSSELGSSNYGPMYSTATANATSRTAVIYPSAQLTSIAEQVLTSIYFKRLTAAEMLGTPNLKIYLKETASDNWGTASIDWSTSITGATLVYDSNPVTALGTSAGWKSFEFSTNFSYSGTQNLAVFFEYSNATASNSITYAYEYTAPCIITTDSNTTKYANNNTGILATTLASKDYRRPLIGFDYEVSCYAPTNLAVTAIGETTAEISWTASSSNPSLGYDYYLSTSPTEPTPSTTATGNVPTGTTKNLTGLSNSTAYYVWVRSNCGTGDVSVWKGSSFVTSCVAISSFPWTENFDTMTTIGANVLPNLCWKSLAGGSSNTIQFTTSNAASQTYNDPRSAPNYITVYYPTTNAAYLYTPGMELTAGQSYDFSFYYIGDNRAGWDGQVVYNTNQSATGATVLGDSYVISATTTSQTNYVRVTRTFVPTTTGTYYFGVKAMAVTSAPFYLGFDDFKVDLSPSCINPTALTATNITATSATISWTAPTTVPSLGYEYYISATNTPPTAATAGTPVTSGTSVNITNLPSNETRYVWVRSLCSATDISSWSDSVSFTTACGAFGSFTEGFENTVTSTIMPSCWSRNIVSTTTDPYIYVSTSDVNTGNRALRFGNSGSATATLYGITPALTDLPLQNHRLKFYARGTVSTVFQVGTMTNPADASTFVLKQVVTLTTSHQQTVINFDTPTTGSYIAFRAAFSSTYSTVTIDDVVWEPIPACPEPTAIVVSDITTTSATASWTAPSSTPSQGYEYYLSTSNTPPTVATTATGLATAATVSLTGLPHSTVHYIWVRSNCGSETSPWSNMGTFATACGVNAAPSAVQNFATYVPQCWSETTGALGTTLSTTTSIWTTTTSFANVAAGTNKGAKVNLYGGTTANPDNDWLISNSIDLGSSPSQFRVKFKMAVTNYNGSVSQTTLGTHTVRVIVSTDNGATWTAANVIKTYTGAGTYSNTGQDESIELTGYSGVVKIGFLATTSSTTLDIDFHIDDFSVEASLSAPSFNTANFKAYPNPVKDFLNLSYTQDISDVAVFNLLGQQVLARKVNATESQIDMSSLSQGTYLVKVTVGDQVKTVKVMKQ
ncbi:T9SS C-terminal target domain-containing protein [Flavobacterium macacae]|uniref:T9SS C-terminal target domain-containing protein n=2 Tax=Flavobacterium macacae TaxID=2488993 RepID=A0A3P3W523_9FLAO|nr:T9SS C-terminal target domain-containing protein [Flavobacterium macacae]